MSKKKSQYEDLQNNIRNLEMPEIEVFLNKYPEKVYVVNLQTKECSCICPKTGLPDFVTLNIDYSPSEVCVELKSFKLYLVEYRNVGIFHEHLVNKILEDLVAACNPRWMRVEAVVEPRGGITTTVSSEYFDKKLKNRKKT